MLANESFTHQGHGDKIVKNVRAWKMIVLTFREIVVYGKTSINSSGDPGDFKAHPPFIFGRGLTSPIQHAEVAQGHGRFALTIASYLAEK